MNGIFINFITYKNIYFLKCSNAMLCLAALVICRLFLLNGIIQRKSNTPKFTDLNFIRCSNMNKYL